MQVQMRRFEYGADVPKAGGRHPSVTAFTSPASEEGDRPRPDVGDDVESGLSLAVPGRLPMFLIAVDARNPSAPAEDPEELTDLSTDPTAPPAGPTLIPFLVRRHRATVGAHGETVWEPAVPPADLSPLVPPAEGWEAVERYLLPSLPPFHDDLLMVASPAGGYSDTPGGRGSWARRARAMETPGNPGAAGRLASVLRCRVPPRRGLPSARF